MTWDVCSPPPTVELPSSCHDSRSGDVIELNVGGRVFVTSRGTLTSEPDSMLARLLSGESSFSDRVDSSGRIFIDREGDTFAHILGYLQRRGRLIGAPNDIAGLARLTVDAEYFGLDRLAEQVRLWRPNLRSLAAALKSPHGSFISLCDLACLGYTPHELKELGFTAVEVQQTGCSASELFELCRHMKLDLEVLRSIIRSGQMVIADGRFGVVTIEKEEKAASPPPRSVFSPRAPTKISTCYHPFGSGSSRCLGSDIELVRVSFIDGSAPLVVGVWDFLQSARVLEFAD
eukprot:TRINITY_DN51026_c0_g1_i1.p1 TRINITY_DN51026_c0_g1~~TRINITY_DN51026_c0_g1_i1.p1  ORF type:complete len:289 (-),score=56.26 TRINITY_DN51026_c0_g1_i1:107-973(-)